MKKMVFAALIAVSLGVGFSYLKSQLPEPEAPAPVAQFSILSAEGSAKKKAAIVQANEAQKTVIAAQATFLSADYWKVLSPAKVEEIRKLLAMPVPADKHQSVVALQVFVVTELENWMRRSRQATDLKPELDRLFSESLQSNPRFSVKRRLVRTAHLFKFITESDRSAAVFASRQSMASRKYSWITSQDILNHLDRQPASAKKGQ